MVENEQGVSTPAKQSGKKVGCWIAGCLTALIIFILFITTIVSVAFWATSGPVKVVEEQLVYLRSGDLDAAYGLTSGDFQKMTSLARFRQFVADYPSLAQNHQANFTSRKVENGIGYIEGSLTAVDGARTPVQYQLVKENSEWKILYIEMAPTGLESAPAAPAVKQPVSRETAPAGNMVMERVEVGTSRAPNGSIIDATTRLPEGTGEIKVSAYVSRVRKGQQVSAVWYFSGEKITDPVVNIMDEDGDFISQFSISPPSNGWPSGRYKIVLFIDGQESEGIEYTIGL